MVVKCKNGKASPEWGWPCMEINYGLQLSREIQNQCVVSNSRLRDFAITTLQKFLALKHNRSRSEEVVTKLVDRVKIVAEVTSEVATNGATSREESFPLLIHEARKLNECLPLLAIVERSGTCPERRLYRQVNSTHLSVNDSAICHFPTPTSAHGVRMGNHPINPYQASLLTLQVSRGPLSISEGLSRLYKSIPPAQW